MLEGMDRQLPHQIGLLVGILGIGLGRLIAIIRNADRSLTRRVRLSGGLLLLGAGLVIHDAHLCTAAERELETGPPPRTADEIEAAVERGFLAHARKGPLFPRIRQQLQKLPPFFADSELGARVRTYYLRQDRTNGDLSEAWVIGGSIHYRSGWLKDTFAVEAEGFTSHSVVAHESRDGTLLLGPGPKGYDVLGIANAKLRYRGIGLTAYRQYLDFPYVNRRDNRMTPQTFEAFTLAKREGRLRFATGYAWRIKLRNADDFISMAEAAGASKDRGLAFGGVMWRPNEDFHVGGGMEIAPDVLAIGYGETAYAFDLRDGLRLRLDGQLTYQQTVGDELLPEEDFETWNAGVRASTTWAGAVFRLGFSITGHERAIMSPWGSNPSYVDLMQTTFNRAGEKAVLAGVSYDFSRLGVAGLSTIVNYVQGWHARVGGVLRDDREVDVTLDYRIPEQLGLYQGLWLRVRAAWLEEESNGKTGTDFRVILRYDFPVI
jgi:hypothetical protein